MPKVFYKNIISELDEAINMLDQRIYSLETAYLEEINSVGNIVKGWDLLMDKYPKKYLIYI